MHLHLLHQAGPWALELELYFMGLDLPARPLQTMLRLVKCVKFQLRYNASHHVQFEAASHPKLSPREASLALAFGAQEQLSPHQTPQIL